MAALLLFIPMWFSVLYCKIHVCTIHQYLLLLYLARIVFVFIFLRVPLGPSMPLGSALSLDLPECENL